MEPAIEELAAEADNKARVIKVNNDKNEKTASKYGVAGSSHFHNL